MSKTMNMESPLKEGNDLSLPEKTPDQTLKSHEETTINSPYKVSLLSEDKALIYEEVT
jgi:hypothetical protein